MLILDTEDRTLQLELGSAVNSDEPEFVASYVDVKAPDLYEPATNHGTTNGATAVTLLAAPSDGRRRQLKFLSIANIDDQANTARLFLDDNGTERTIATITLPVGASLLYTDGEGLRVIDTNGNVLTTVNDPA